jgi:hypothetical protein
MPGGPTAAHIDLQLMPAQFPIKRVLLGLWFSPGFAARRVGIASVDNPKSPTENSGRW